MLKDAFSEQAAIDYRAHINNIMANAAMSQAACEGITAGNSSGGSNGANNNYNGGTIAAPNTGGQYVPIVAPQPGGVIPPGGITPNTWTYKTWMAPGNGLEQFPAGLVHDRLEEYLNKRGHEVMRGRFEHDFLVNVLGLVPEEMKDRWFILKDKDEMTDDPTVCSSVRGKAIPILHKCNDGGKFYSKTDTNMTGDKIWCLHCEEDLPEDLETMLVISHVM